jgi:protein-S-isoprenylcysteine O-methyltransferase Ste14
MVSLYLGLLGLFSFVVGVGVLGIWLRKYPSKENAEKSSRIIHFLFFAGLGTPVVIGFFYPGLTHLDALIGIAPLPLKTLFLILGLIIGIPGLTLQGITLKALRTMGSGANAFRLTQRIVVQDIFKYTRNPMSLGYYCCAIAIGFIFGSTLLTLFVLLGLIPAHLFALKFFEEQELGLRFGESYAQYKQNVPFLFPKLKQASK